MLMPEREAKSGPRRRLTHRASSQRNCACLMTTPVGPDFSVEVTFQNETFADTRSIRLRLNEMICRRGILSVGKGAPAVRYGLFLRAGVAPRILLSAYRRAAFLWFGRCNGTSHSYS